jgi:hypothetical protein
MNDDKSSDQFAGAASFLRAPGASPPPQNAAGRSTGEKSGRHNVQPGGLKQSNAALGYATSPDADKRGAYEERRNSAACFANRNRTESWHADFVGVTVTEGLHDGCKCWVSVKKRLDRNGKLYVSVSLKPMAARGGSHDAR